MFRSFLSVYRFLYTCVYLENSQNACSDGVGGPAEPLDVEVSIKIFAGKILQLKITDGYELSLSGAYSYSYGARNVMLDSV